MTGIYKITNPIGLIYIGQSRNILSRLKAYKYLNCKDQLGIYNSLKKYGYENHSFEVIKECNTNELNFYEKHYIDFYDSYNKGLNCNSNGYYDIKNKSTLNKDNMTISITTTYKLVWRYLETDYYFTKCGKCFNVKRNKELRRVLNGYSKGFTLNGKFETLEQISKKLIKVENINIPF